MPSLSTLHPSFAPAAQWFFDLVHYFDARFVVTSAYRSPAEQTRLWEAYQRGTPGLYTVLPPGRSQHERGLAFDMARLGIEPKSDPVLASAGELWRALGGRWAGPSDPVHFEAPGSLTGRGT